MQEQTIIKAIAAIQLNRLIGNVLITSGYKSESKKFEPAAAQLIRLLADNKFNEAQRAHIIDGYYIAQMALVQECLDMDAVIRRYMKEAKPRQQISGVWLSGYNFDNYFTIKRSSLTKFITDHENSQATMILMKQAPIADAALMSTFSSILRNADWTPMLEAVGIPQARRSTYAEILHMYTGSVQGRQQLGEKMKAFGVVAETVNTKTPTKTSQQDGTPNYNTYIEIQRSTLLSQPNVMALARSKLFSAIETDFKDVVETASKITIVHKSESETAEAIMLAFNSAVAKLTDRVKELQQSETEKKEKALRARALKALKDLPLDVREAVIKNPDLLKLA